MKKPFKYTDLSATARCVRCGKKLKNNLLVKKPKARFCYACFQKTKLEVVAMPR